LTIAGGSEFQVEGTAQLKDRPLMSVRLNDTTRNRTVDNRNDRYKPSRYCVWDRSTTSLRLFSRW